MKLWAQDLKRAHCHPRPQALFPKSLGTRMAHCVCGHVATSHPTFCRIIFKWQNHTGTKSWTQCARSSDTVLMLLALWPIIWVPEGSRSRRAGAEIMGGGELSILPIELTPSSEVLRTTVLWNCSYANVLAPWPLLETEQQAGLCGRSSAESSGGSFLPLSWGRELLSRGSQDWNKHVETLTVIHRDAMNAAARL